MGARRVAHVLWRSAGGIRRHVRYVAANPPTGWTTEGVYGPAELREYFGGVPFRAVSGLGVLRAGREADLVHAHGVRAATCALLPGRPPTVVTMHVVMGSSGLTARSPIARAVARAITARADVVVAVSDVSGIGVRAARVIPPAFEPLASARKDRACVRRELGVGPTDVVAVCVARLDRNKRIDLVLRAAADTGCVLWIVGSGPERARLEMVSGPNVRILGVRDDVADLLGAADLFVLASGSESYGIAVAEAIAAGLPVVATRTGAIEEIVDGAGVLVDADDTAAFVASMRELIDDPRERERLSSIARDMPIPDPRVRVEALGAIYNELYARRIGTVS